jgi:hypothetical protein
VRGLNHSVVRIKHLVAKELNYEIRKQIFLEILKNDFASIWEPQVE